MFLLSESYLLSHQYLNNTGVVQLWAEKEV